MEWLDPHARMRIGMNIVHLTASTFFGGPERQMLGLSTALAPHLHTTIVSFAEGGRCREFLSQVRDHGVAGHMLRCDTPKMLAAVSELEEFLRGSADVLLCHGYKSVLLGRMAARRVGVPAVAVSRGWTSETRKVRAYEWLERRVLRHMDRVVCVSEGQAAKVRRWCGVPEARLRVIPNAARLEAFTRTDPQARPRLLSHFSRSFQPKQIILAAGRLSPEKGFDVLIEAASDLCRQNAAAGVVIFGEGAERELLEKRIESLGLRERVVLPGFRTDLDSLISGSDVVALSSYTEGLPNILLEASAAGLPIAATAVGGCPEVVVPGETGLLVPPGEPASLAHALGQLLADASLRTRMGAAGRQRMRDRFTFDAQARAYLDLFAELVPQTLSAAA